MDPVSGMRMHATWREGGASPIYVGFLMGMLCSTGGPGERNWLYHVHCVAGLGSLEALAFGVIAGRICKGKCPCS